MYDAKSSEESYWITTSTKHCSFYKVFDDRLDFLQKLSMIGPSKFLNNISSGNELWSQWIDWSNHRATSAKIVTRTNSSLLQNKSFGSLISVCPKRTFLANEQSSQNSRLTIRDVGHQFYSSVKWLIDNYFPKPKTTPYLSPLDTNFATTDSSN